MAISAKDVKKLRDMTGAGMMDCKKALKETDGDFDEAVKWLQVKGISKAAKKADRVAAEGLIGKWLSEDQTEGVLVEVNCETDFVTRNENFQSFVQKVTATVGESAATTIEEAEALTIEGKTLVDYTTSQIAVIGENIKVRRIVRLKAESGVVGAYSHTNDQIGVLVQVEGATGDDAAEFARDIAMHTAAMRPLYLSPEDVDDAAAEKQAELFAEKLKEEGKPEKIIPKIIEGQMRKWRGESSLLGQAYAKNPDLTVAQFQKEFGDVEIKNFVRFEVGEGIEKKEDDFAAEVAAMNKG